MGFNWNLPGVQSEGPAIYIYLYILYIYPEKKSKEFMAFPTLWEDKPRECWLSGKEGIIMKIREVRRC